MLAALSAHAQVFTNVAFFSGSIPLNGDITNFFQADGLTPKTGVCVVNNPDGLYVSPLSALSGRDAQPHPTGFNQRRILSAYNPDLDGGTIFIGIDLPGGSGADNSSLMTHSFPGNANPNYFDGAVGKNLGGNGFGRGPILPFDADGNGEPDTIGRKADGRNLYRCFGMALNDTPDMVNCTGGTAGMTDNPRWASGEGLGALENYVAAIVFGNGQTISVELFQDTFTPAGIVELRLYSSPAAPFGALASTSTGGSGVVLGYDVEFAITNVNRAVPDLGARMRQTIIVYSACDESEDFNLMECSYARPAAKPASLSLEHEPEGMVLKVLCPDDRPCMIQRTTNLVDWEDWQIATPANGSARLTDPYTEGSPRRFYRASTF